MFKTAEECINFIENIKRLDRRKDLKRMEYALSLLGNPHLGYKKVLVFGTNGKGSTLSFLKNILMQNNLKVGNFISPYVICFNERIAINDDYICDNDLVLYTNKVYEVCLKIQEEGDIVTFFEVLTLLAFLYFKDQSVDIALMEIGIEGYLDATLVANYDLKLHTNVGYDHMNILGQTLEEITDSQLAVVNMYDNVISSDANFIKQGENTFFQKQVDFKVIDTNIQYTYDNQKLIFEYDNHTVNLNLVGHHQVSNSVLAIEGAKFLLPHIDYKTITNGLYKTSWPGRFEIFNINGKKVVIDGAHNIDGVSALITSINNLLQEKVEVIFTALKDKETDKMIHSLETVALNITFTTISDPRAKDPNLLYAESKHSKKEVIFDFKEAIDKYLETTNTLLITGSLHFISDVRKYLQKK